MPESHMKKQHFQINPHRQQQDDKALGAPDGELLAKAE